MAIFDGFTDREVDTIKNTGTHVTLPADWSPISEKTAADKAYIIVSGEASVRRGGDEIARLGPGDIFGEGAIVNHKLRNASIVTTTKVELIHFTREQVNQLRDQIPAFAAALDRTTQERPGK
jgi:CRP/FNR family transcriptional regulator, cyclic AMP receptor protein